MKEIDFWFSVGSTYTYLTVMRLPADDELEGIRFNWRPYSVRALMLEMDNIPFAGKPAKMNYMWRDLERRANRYGIPIQLPASYPLENFDNANRVAILARREGWCREYVQASYEQWFQRGLPAGEEPNLSASIQAAGHDPGRVVELAASEEIEAAYLAATSEARALGIFGSPTFVVDAKELFWGDDRLEDAVDFAITGD